MAKNPPLKITLFARSLNKGGAERQILYLARGLQDQGHRVTILTLYPPTPDWYLNDDVYVRHLGKKSRWDLIGFAKSYSSYLKSEKPDILYSFLTVQNILACLAAPFIKGKVFCGVRASDMDLRQYGRLDLVLDYLEKLLFKLNIQVISNSQAGKDWITKRFPSLEAKISVVPNGLDMSTCIYSKDQRQLYRKMWGVAEDDFLIGHVGRYDPMKDHETFITAASSVLKLNKKVRFVCWGHGTPDYTDKIQNFARLHNVPIIWHYEPGNPCYSAFDLYCSTSAFGEGHSNTLTEAMAHGIPCISTDVGDAKIILGKFGKVVPKRLSTPLAHEIVNAIKITESKINQHQIKWIESKYSIKSLIKNTILKII